MKKRNVIIAAALASIMLVTGCQQNGKKDTAVTTAAAESTTKAAESSEATSTSETNKVEQTEASSETEVTSETEGTPTDTDVTDEDQSDMFDFQIAGKTYTVFGMDSDYQYTEKKGYYTFNEDGSGACEDVSGVSGVPISWTLGETGDLHISLGSPDDVVEGSLSYDDEHNMYFCYTNSDETIFEMFVEGRVDENSAVKHELSIGITPGPDDYVPTPAPEEAIETGVSVSLNDVMTNSSKFLEGGIYTYSMNMTMINTADPTQTAKGHAIVATDPSAGTYLDMDMFFMAMKTIQYTDGNVIVINDRDKTYAKTTSDKANITSASVDTSAGLVTTKEPVTTADVVMWNGEKVYRFYVKADNLVNATSNSDMYLYANMDTLHLCGIYQEAAGAATVATIDVKTTVDPTLLEPPAGYTEVTYEQFQQSYFSMSDE